MQMFFFQENTMSHKLEKNQPAHQTKPRKGWWQQKEVAEVVFETWAPNSAASSSHWGEERRAQAVLRHRASVLPPQKKKYVAVSEGRK